MPTKSKPVEMAPVLQSLKEYLSNHYTDDLLEEVKAAMSLNLVEGLDVAESACIRPADAGLSGSG